MIIGEVKTENRILTIGTAGCNLNCYFCSARTLNEGQKYSSHRVTYTSELVVRNAIARASELAGVVVTGGEPTIHPDLPVFLEGLKKGSHLPIILETNGLNTTMLEMLIREGLVDFIALDLKAPPDKYSSICLCDVDLYKIHLSIELLMSGPLPHEFTTTLVPELTMQDIDLIAAWITGARMYALIPYLPPKRTYNFYDPRLYGKPYPLQYIKNTLEFISPRVFRCRIKEGYSPLSFSESIG